MHGSSVRFDLFVYIASAWLFHNIFEYNYLIFRVVKPARKLKIIFAASRDVLPSTSMRGFTSIISNSRTLSCAPAAKASSKISCGKNPSGLGALDPGANACATESISMLTKIESYERVLFSNVSYTFFIPFRRTSERKNMLAPCPKSQSRCARAFTCP